MSKFSKNVKGLLIDIDDTIVCQRADGHGEAMRNTSSLMDVLHRAAVEFGGLTPEETARRIERVNTQVPWWHWSDFIVELELNPKQFWEYAYEVESKYFQPTGPEILSALTRLHDASILLYVASNNPSSGILHKLRLAGIAHPNGTTLFSQLLGATELHAMKWDPLYWKKALAHIALDAEEVATVGDNLHDDYEVPQSVGIACSFIIDRTADRSAENTDTRIFVRSFEEIAGIVLPTDNRNCENGTTSGI